MKKIHSKQVILKIFLWAVVVCFSAFCITGFCEVIRKEFFGLHIHNADAGTPWPNIPFGSWRLWDTRVQWPSIQPAKGEWDFSKLDLLVGLSQITRVEVVLPLGLSPRWASARPSEKSAYGDGMAAEPKSIEDWKQYIRTLAIRYNGRIKYYEIWNEPNDKGFFSGSNEKLVELTCTAYQTLKAVNPSIQLVSPAYTGVQNIQKLEDFLISGGAKCIDVVAHHFYVTPGTPENIPAYVLKVQQAMERQGFGRLPLWNTEIGWLLENTDGSPNGPVTDYWTKITIEKSAAIVAKSYVLGAAAGIDRFFWYSWDHKTMGLIEPSSKQIKPAGTALGIISNWMIGKNRPVCGESNSIWTCSIKDTTTERQIIVWSNAKATQYLIPKSWKLTSVERADGRVQSIEAGAGVDLDELPRLITLSVLN